MPTRPKPAETVDVPLLESVEGANGDAAPEAGGPAGLVGAEGVNGAQLADAPPPPPLIYAAMADVFAAVGPIAKNLKNAQAGYASRSIDDVYDALHGPLADAGLFVAPEVLDASYETVEVGKNRTLMRQATVKVRYHFCARDGSSVSVLMVGEALDSGDKATGKAMSQAIKVALIQTFVIPIGSPDPDAETHERAPAPEPPGVDGFATREEAKAEVAAIRELVEQHSLGEWVKDQGFPWPWPRAVCDAIRAKVAEVAGGLGGDPPAAEAQSVGSTAKMQDPYDTAAQCSTCGNPTNDHEPGCPEGDA